MSYAQATDTVNMVGRAVLLRFHSHPAYPARLSQPHAPAYVYYKYLVLAAARLD